MIIVQSSIHPTTPGPEFPFYHLLDSPSPDVKWAARSLRCTAPFTLLGIQGIYYPVYASEKPRRNQGTSQSADRGAFPVSACHSVSDLLLNCAIIKNISFKFIVLIASHREPPSLVYADRRYSRHHGDFPPVPQPWLYDPCQYLSRYAVSSAPIP